MNECVKFHKVSYEQFKKDIEDCFPKSFFPAEIIQLYDNIQLPKRATEGSAGYDFFSPVSFSLSLHTDSVKFPTGIRAEIDSGWVLMIVPRSGLGFKYEVRLANTVGIIDSDYFFAENEGDIQAKLVGAKKNMRISAGDRIMQGILLPFGIAYNEDKEILAKRTGGFGSSGI